MTLVEILVVVAILVALGAIVIPTVSSYLQLQQRQTARTLAMQYQMLHDEAVLRNVTFRFAFHVDEGYYDIEVGSPETLIFDSPEARADYEQQQEDKMKLLTKEEREAEQAQGQSDFAKLQAQFDTQVQLPGGTKFGGVYTPQYGKLVTPNPDYATGDTDTRDAPQVVYSYVFPNGFAEHAVIQLVDASDPTDGYTVEIEPMSGEVHLWPDLRSYDQTLSFIPDAPPELPN